MQGISAILPNHLGEYSERDRIESDESRVYYAMFLARIHLDWAVDLWSQSLLKGSCIFSNQFEIHLCNLDGRFPCWRGYLDEDEEQIQVLVAVDQAWVEFSLGFLRKWCEKKSEVKSSSCDLFRWTVGKREGTTVMCFRSRVPSSLCQHRTLHISGLLLNFSRKFKEWTSKWFCNWLAYISNFSRFNQIATFDPKLLESPLHSLIPIFIYCFQDSISIQVIWEGGRNV